MDNTEVVAYLGKALYLTLMLSMPAILVASIVGVLFAVVQALTQIQEQTLTFAAKLVGTMVALALTVRWMGSEIYQFSSNLMDAVQFVGR